MLTIVLVASGSGGHIFPAISLAQKLKTANKDYKIIFITRSGKLESEILSSFNFEIIGLDVEKIRFSFSIFSLGFKFLKVFFRSFSILKKIKASVVVGFGGYLSVPVIAAAYFSRIPTIIHEQNVELGKANRLLASLVNKIAVSFTETKANRKYPLLRKKIILTGNPVRNEFYFLDREECLKYFGFVKNKFTLLILGGSQGSLSVNILAKVVASSLSKDLLAKLQIIHICGVNGQANLEAYYRNLGIDFKVFSFLSEVARAYRITDLAIARAGATTVAELSSYGVPAVLIPYPYAGKHQYKNAQVLTNRGLAFLAEENNDAPKKICDIIEQTMTDKNILQNIHSKLIDFSHKYASDNLAKEVLALC